jgi:hypothetical protein
MLRPAIAVVTFNVFLYTALAICNRNYVFKTPPNFLPIISKNVCAEPPGGIATDGCDDVCLLTKCCSNWMPNGGTATLQNEKDVDCPTVNCGNVCRMACDRQGTSEPCDLDYNCGDLRSDGRVFVFSRNGNCLSPTLDSGSPTHIGFGFEVAQDVYMYGSVENGAGCTTVEQNFDNGFWMTTGSKDQMLATFRKPWLSLFHGTISPIKVAKYDQYKMSAVQTPKVCDAVKAAENLYSVGYGVFGNNCLNAVYTVLLAYGVTFPKDISPSQKWCPSGTSSFSFFGALTSGSAPPINNWSSAQPFPTTGSPVTAVNTCPTTVPLSCAHPANPTPGLSIPSVAPDSCASCQLSVYALGIQGLAAGCNVPTPLGTASDVSVLLCDSSYNGLYSQFCATLCANPCATYSIDSWIQSAGSQYMPNVGCIGNLCPGFEGDGRCSSSINRCSCAVGSNTCVAC